MLALTLLVNLLGAAGIFAFERDSSNGAITSHGSALWWTAMTLTTMGADYFPRTPEGPVLGLLLAIHGCTVFGYVTASIASSFVTRDSEEGEVDLSVATQLRALRSEVTTLARAVAVLLDRQRMMEEGLSRDRANPSAR